jgi:hypothetical protein
MISNGFEKRKRVGFHGNFKNPHFFLTAKA